jgi:hypothetical protein
MSEEQFEATVGEYRIGDKAIYLTGVRRGEKNEQERIIKLLNDTVDNYLSEKLLVEAAVVANAIAYIKNFGE